MTVKKVKKTTQKPLKSAKPAKPAVKTLKPVNAKAVLSADDNLKKLERSKLPMLFVKKHEGSWNHQDWLMFLEEIREKGYDPIDTDQVGMILEEKKVVFLSGK